MRFRLQEKDREEAEGFCFAHALLVAYLGLIAEEDELQPALFRRDGAGRADPERLRTGPPILFDPRGGTFVAAARTRRFYAQWRATLVNSLWDLAMKQKAAYWLEQALS